MASESPRDVPPQTPPVGGTPMPSALRPVNPTLPQEDLTQDRLLALLPRDEKGRPLLGRIPLICRIGRGGMGAVYYAVHPRLHVEVAVKVLPFTLVEQDPRLVDRFASEARMAASLASDHIVRVLDVDQERDTHFLVMEYVPGESAGAYLKRRGALDEGEAVEIVLAATRGLAAAHARGIIHRDIKPDNILIPNGERRRAKLADLGLAKPEGGGQSIGTQSHVAMGTPGFMAPEQVDDARSAGPPADVFSMGATLYALLAGRAPFAGSSLGAILRDTAIKEPDPLPVRVGAAIRNLVQRCLSKEPRRRFTNGMELLAVLDQPIVVSGPPSAVCECGFVNSATTKFCGECGRSLSARPVESTLMAATPLPSGPACPKCGRQSLGEAKFCEGCGESLFENCPKCRTEGAAPLRFCRGCGCDVPRHHQELEQRLTEPLERGRSLLKAGKPMEAVDALLVAQSVSASDPRVRELEMAVGPFLKLGAPRKVRVTGLDVVVRETKGAAHIAILVLRGRFESRALQTLQQLLDDLIRGGSEAFVFDVKAIPFADTAAVEYLRDFQASHGRVVLARLPHRMPWVRAIAGSLKRRAFNSHERALRHFVDAMVVPFDLKEALAEEPEPFEPLAVEPEVDGEASRPVREEERFDVFLSPIQNRKKQDAAALLIASTRGCSIGEARELARRLTIQVASGVSRGEAEAVLDGFKKISVTGRIVKAK